MSDIGDVMVELSDRFATVTGLRTELGFPGSVTPPVVVIPYPDPLEFDATMGGGSSHRLTFECTVLLPSAVDRARHERIRSYLAPTGEESLRAAVNGQDLTTVHHFWVRRARNFRYVDVGGTTYPGFDMDVEAVLRG